MSKYLRQLVNVYFSSFSPNPFIICIYMDISQENSLYSYLYLKQARMSFFSFKKLENKRTEQVLPGVERSLVLVEGSEVMGKGTRR
jgi:hypothetical protein